MPGVTPSYAIGLTTDKRAERKSLIHVATWLENSTGHAVILGKRTEDSSIDFNADIETTTDILGINYTDVNKTQPQQSFDPAYVLGGDDLMRYLNDKALSNDINGYNGTFDVYVIASYMSDSTTTTGTTYYRTVKHKGCSIIPDSLGGESYVSMPFNVYYSNDVEVGYLTSISRTDLTTYSTLTSAFKKDGAE